MNTVLKYFYENRASSNDSYLTSSKKNNYTWNNHNPLFTCYKTKTSDETNNYEIYTSILPIWFNRLISKCVFLMMLLHSSPVTHLVQKASDIFNFVHPAIFYLSFVIWLWRQQVQEGNKTHPSPQWHSQLFLGGGSLFFLDFIKIRFCLDVKTTILHTKCSARAAILLSDS